MSKIDASAVYPLGQMLKELAAGTPFVVLAGGRKFSGPAEFLVIDGIATLAYEGLGEAERPWPKTNGNEGGGYIPVASNGTAG